MGESGVLPTANYKFVCLFAHLTIYFEPQSVRSGYYTPAEMKFFIAIVALAAVAYAQQQEPIAILKQAQDISPDGSYAYSYETQNGISAAESGEPRVQGEEGPAVAAQGQFQYTAPDGTPIQVSYVADENGFQPQGQHLPVAPPIPEAIQRAIEYNLAHPEENGQQ